MRILCSFLVIFLWVSCANDRLYDISGRVQDTAFEGKMIYLSYFDNGRLCSLDSALVANGMFHFKGEQAQSMMAILRFDSTIKTSCMPVEFLLEAGHLKASIDTLSTVQGTLSNDDLSRLVSSVSRLEQRMAGIERRYVHLEERGELTALDEDSLQNLYQTIRMESYGEIDAYIDLHSNEVTGGYVLATYRNYYDFKSLDTKLTAGNEAFRSYAFISPILAELEKLRRVSEGNKYTDITLPDVDGKTRSLSSLIDTTRYTLIDFWASWCAPCRALVPALKSLALTQKEYLTVIGVSLDTDADLWRKSAAELPFTRAQLSDLRGWKSSAAETYLVRGIPHLVLLDKQGVIVGTGISLDEVAAILSRQRGN